ncbi:hypothetical protein RUND412_004407 [Rhizina undulata]
MNWVSSEARTNGMPIATRRGYQSLVSADGDVVICGLALTERLGDVLGGWGEISAEREPVEVVAVMGKAMSFSEEERQGLADGLLGLGSR